MWDTASVPLNKLINSTHFRFAVALTTVFAAIYLVAGWIAFREVDAELQERISLGDVVAASGYAEIYHASGRTGLINAVRASTRPGGPDDEVVWLGTLSGEHLAGQDLLTPLALRSGDVNGAELTNDLDERYHIQVVDFDDVRLITGVSYEESDEILALVAQAFGGAALLTLLFAGLAGLFLARRGQSRIDAASVILDQAASGELTHRLPVSNAADDIDQVSIRINSALDQLQATMEGLRQVSADIAHDLRTPINRLSIHIEHLSEGVDPDSSFGQTLDLALAEVRQIAATFDALLRIAQIEAGAGKQRFQPIRLADAVQGLFEIYAAVAEENGQTLQLSLTGDIAAEFRGDRDLVVQLTANLVENAIRHSGADAVIDMETFSELDAVGLRVRDNGPGIPADEHARVLKRFHRLDKSRHTPGSGLGLALVSAVAELHGATLTLSDAQPGLTVEIRFPRLRQ
jgi:signal transduction histidine kinase